MYRVVILKKVQYKSKTCPKVQCLCLLARVGLLCRLTMTVEVIRKRASSEEHRRKNRMKLSVLGMHLAKKIHSVKIEPMHHDGEVSNEY